MAPKQTKPITMKDLASRNPSAKVMAIYNRALKHAYKDQQKILKKAKLLK